MSLNQASNAFDLLGQATAQPALPVSALEGAHDGNPKLDVAWGDFRQSLWSSVRALLTRSGISGKFWDTSYFRDCWVERRIPKRAVLAAALWHVVFLVMPSLQLSMTPRRNPAFDNTVLTWSGPIDDLPLLEIPGEKAKPSPRGEPDKPMPRAGADAFHPRQRIFTDPVHPTHPRQMLVNSAAPAEPPKILPNLPNIVELQQSAGPARPRIQISEQVLAKLRPKERRVAAVTSAPLPDLPGMEQKPAEIPMQFSQNAPAKPKLELNAGATPRLAERTQTGDVGPAPEIGQTQNSANGNTSTFIALSATPGPPAPAVQPPAGNLAARVAISPEGKQPGAPGGAANSSPANGGTSGGPESHGGTGSGAGKNSLGVSISGGNPTAKSGVSGLGGNSKIVVPSSHTLITRPDAHVNEDEPPVRSGPPNFAALPPGAKPEQVFVSKKIYKLLVNMPNLNSATGSWILNFSELRVDSGTRIEGELSGPVPLRKIDPKYPPTLANERVEGEVILYAVIRKDGSVDSIQLVRGIDERLDANAMEALGQWKFRPASKQGTSVDLEAIVHIPFHAPSER